MLHCGDDDDDDDDDRGKLQGKKRVKYNSSIG